MNKLELYLSKERKTDIKQSDLLKIGYKKTVTEEYSFKLIRKFLDYESLMRVPIRNGSQIN